jgi:hypothetical protein
MDAVTRSNDGWARECRELAKIIDGLEGFLSVTIRLPFPCIDVQPQTTNRENILLRPVIAGFKCRASVIDCMTKGILRRYPGTQGFAGRKELVELFVRLDQRRAFETFSGQDVFEKVQGFHHATF